MKFKALLYLCLLILLAACQPRLIPGIPTEPTGIVQAREGSPTPIATLPPAAPTAQVSQVPLPAAENLLPLNSAVFTEPIIPLSWDPSPGAVGYRLQVAKDEDYSNMAMDIEVAAPPRYTNPLPAGTYFWHVQALAEGSTPGLFSVTQTFRIQTRTEPDQAEVKPTQKRLDIELIRQHKDSAMLLLESDRESGAHAWNMPHTEYDPTDGADAANSPLAALAMINHYYGGNLTQDRIGFEIYHDLAPSAEKDLPYSNKMTFEQVIQAYIFALGSTPQILKINEEQHSQESIWQQVLVQIDTGHPVMALAGDHAVVIDGYEQRAGERYFLLHDPGQGSYPVEYDGVTWQALLLVNSPLAAQLEPGLLLDSDRDGILDFDESLRFSTDVFNADSDSDGIGDLQEIRATVFDELNGLSHGGKGRDIDGDRLPMELDYDSDGGGCLDGFEDKSRDGVYNPEFSETSNFDGTDDRCYSLEMTWNFKDDWGKSVVTWAGSFLIDEKQTITGIGSAKLVHHGPCIVNTTLFPFQIGGKQSGDMLELRIGSENTFEIGTVKEEELAPGCTIGWAIQENWAVANGLFAARQPEIEILTPHEVESVKDFYTANDAPRLGVMKLVVKNIGLQVE